MTRREKYPETETFHFYNANPFGLVNSCDCVPRAVSLFFGYSWSAMVRDMTECGIREGYVLDDPNTVVLYMKKKGYAKKRMPRREDNTRYTAREFCKEIAEPGKKYLLSLAGHYTVVYNQKIWDTWDCGDKSVGNYWVNEFKER